MKTPNSKCQNDFYFTQHMILDKMKAKLTVYTYGPTGTEEKNNSCA